MNKLKHGVASFVIFSTLVSLMVVVYNGMYDEYELTDQDLRDGKTIAEKLESLNIIQGINDIGRAIETLKTVTISNAFDLLGALAGAGTGVLRVIGGIVTLPAEIIGIVTEYYFVPAAISTLVGALTIIYIGFLLLSAYMKWEV